jgi:hypothetical protein
MPGSTYLTATSTEKHRRSREGTGEFGTKRLRIRPFPDLHFPPNQSRLGRKFGGAAVAEFAGLARNLPSQLVDLFGIGIRERIPKPWVGGFESLPACQLFFEAYHAVLIYFILVA